LTKFSNLPKWASPGPAIKAKVIAKGKTVMVVPYDSAIPYNVAFAQAVQAADKLAGLKTIVYQTNGSTSSWAAGVELGITDHVAAIDLISGVATSFIEPQIKQATRAGIAVIGSTNNDPSQPSPSYLTAVVPLNYEQAGMLEADQAVVDTNGACNVLIITSTEVPPSPPMTQEVNTELTNDCTTLTVHTLNVQPADWGTGIPSGVASALTADPGINYVLPNYDSEASLAQAGITQAGKKAGSAAGDVGIASFNGTPGPMALVQDGAMAMNAGEDITWAGYATTDETLRVIGHAHGKVRTRNEHIPLRVFNSSNATAVGVPPNLTSGYGTAYKGYLKLWGLK
jgi:ribose transport system substrate-binding protein